jgi:hypothetical protein
MFMLVSHAREIFFFTLHATSRVTDPAAAPLWKIIKVTSKQSMIMLKLNASKNCACQGIAYVT